ncbi:MAG: hypothetical protein RLY14_1654 [Planctomycetota bacterium]|jgi:hypothetical protein
MRFANRALTTIILSFGLITPSVAQEQGEESDAKFTTEQLDFFESKIRPLLVEHCYNCHSSEGQGTRGGLAVDTREGLQVGGESGPAVVPGNLEESLLWNAVNHQDLRMPPRNKLPPQSIADIRQWIEMGAPDPRSGRVAPVNSQVSDEDIEKGREFWSFKSPQVIAPKTLQQFADWPKSDIDRYVAAGFEQQQLTPSPDTPAALLLRRIYFDLVGLPPLPSDVAAFEKDFLESQDKAIEYVVDELLNSPQFGERWGRHWLDIARYAESTGKEFDSTFPHAWRYRDYVIDSFQKDKPYNKFVQEQVAGDLLPAKTDQQWQENLIATGFLAIGPKALLEQNPRQFQADLIDEQIDTVTRVVLGVSVACARCHDHKFDPIRQTDYYALAGIFQSTETLYGGVRTQRNRQPSGLIALPIDDHNPNDQPIAPNELARLRERVRELEMEQMQARRMAFMGNNNSANRNSTNPRDSKNDRDGKPPETNNNPARAFINQAIYDQQIAAIKARISTVDEQGKPLTLCMGVQDRERISNARLLVRGEIDRQAQEVQRGFVKLLSPQAVELSTNSSGRLELARWLSDPSNPLTARVMVNRIWQHLIGKPLVSEPDNFGMSGPGTKHQALLDYLAIKFMEDGWSVKKSIRSIVLSRVYRLSSEVQKEDFEKDPENEYLARGNRKRLDAEALRDSMLTISGQIDLKRPRGSVISNIGFAVIGPNGPVAPVLPALSQNTSSKAGDDAPAMMMEEQARRTFRLGNNQSNPMEAPLYYRSVYLPIARNLLPRSLDVFDFAEPSMVVTIREQSSTADQALYLLNNDFVMSQSDSIARRIFREREKPAERVKLLFALMFSREPTQEELQLSMNFLRDAAELAEGRNSAENTFSAWSQLCQSLMATAEFRWLN